MAFKILYSGSHRVFVGHKLGRRRQTLTSNACPLAIVIRASKLI